MNENHYSSEEIMDQILKPYIRKGDEAIIREYSKHRPKRLSPEEKCAETCNRITGRITLDQIRILNKFGLSTEKIMNWTIYKASQEITKRTK